jgi:hypothetical protein
MLRPLNKVQLAYFVQLLEHPEVLAGRYYEMTTYKQSVGIIWEMLMNALVADFNNSQFREMLVFAYIRWKRENNREESDIDLLPYFIKVLRQDIVKRGQLEMSLREEV